MESPFEEVTRICNYVFSGIDSEVEPKPARTLVAKGICVVLLNYEDS